MSDPKDAAASTLHDMLVVTNDTRYLIIVRDFVQRMIRQSALDAAEENKIILAVDEAISNIIEHGYGPDREGSIEIEVEADARAFKIVIRDEGREFDPGDKAEVDLNKHISAGKKKGLGIFLMRRIMDEVRYSYKDGRQNELVLVKHIERG
jgi:serine/threonine-protein kinase RsbW